MSLDVYHLTGRRNDTPFNRLAVGDLLERNGASRPDDVALIASTPDSYTEERFQRLTYGELNRYCNQFAQALLEVSSAPEQKCLYLCENTNEALIAKFGMAKAGWVSVPVNPNLSADVLAYLVDLVEPRLLLCDSPFVERVQEALAPLDRNVDLVIPINGESVDDIKTFADFIAGQDERQPEVKIHGDDVWEILFTSGTTSMPKGAMISHQYSYLAGYRYGMHFSRGVLQPHHYRMVSFLPVVYHCADQTLPMSCFLHGGALVIGRELDFEALLDAMTQEKVTSLWPGSPNAMRAIVETYDAEPERYDLSHLTTILYGYAVLPPELVDDLKRISQPELQIINSFAQTEVLAGFALYHDEKPRNEIADRQNMVGRADALLEARIAGEPLGKRKTGEVCYRSPFAFSGYYKNPEETEKAIRDDWFYSGDVIMYDENDQAIMVDRVKDMIKTGGENVSSSRVETVLASHPDVKQAAVVGLPDKRWGEAVTGAVVLKPEAQVTAQELIAYCRERLAGFETPKAIYFVDHLPESIGGKIKKPALKEELGRRKNAES